MTNTFHFRYGHGELEFSVPPELQTELILPVSVKPEHSSAVIIQNSLNNPLKNVSFENQVNESSRVAITVNDKTRPVPNNLLLPPLLEKILAAGVKKENIIIIIAMGTHSPMPQREFTKVIPEVICENFRVVSHNCDDGENLVYKGLTTAGTPVYVNRLFDAADVHVVVGNIEPHHFAGFSGGVKSASIGVCGRKTINANHRHLLHPDSIVGNFDTNPLRQDIEEIGRMVRVNYALNVVMSFEKEIVACFWGHPTDVIREGIKISRSVSMTTIGSKADLVIASAGGYPKDINLYQAQKAMTHASLVVRPGGIILLAAACEEGVGSQSYEDFMADIFTHQDVLTRFKQQGFQVGPHKAVQIAQIAQKHPILLLSQLQPEMVQKLLLTPVTTVKEGIEQALRIDPTIHSVTILPYAVSTIPKID